ncbi:ribonuclease HIII [Melioribacteraceae bacterium 4301-Me]|uniref:ribonuclease HIII n=1 Tax=Pyranulibacter aquaticus TaxID=3163344 RepID=UPI00359AA5B7
MQNEKVAEELIEKISLLLKNNFFNPSAIEKKDYNFELTVEKNHQKVKVQVYFGKKGIKVILQGNAENELYKEVERIIADEPKFQFTEEKILEPDEYIGSDESGKGDFFGPLVTAAFYVNELSKKELLKLGVRDSKDVSDTQISFIANQIKKRFSDDFEIVIITPLKYNELYKSFKNLNKILNWSHSKAIENLLKRKKCSYIITDKFSNENLQLSFSNEFNNIEFFQFQKAEKYIGVAAASILARNRVNSWFEEQKKNGLELPKGSSESVEKIAKDIVLKYGKDKLSELAKEHFKITSKV